MNHSRFLALVATVAASFCAFPLSASDEPLDLFGPPIKCECERCYDSKHPVLLPPEKPLDLFETRPSPTLAELKAQADRRYFPDADRPIVVGMCCEGVIANYDEAYRLSKKTGKPLRVMVGQPWEHIQTQGKTDDGYLKCRIDEGDDPRFQVNGVLDFEWHNGFLYGKPGNPPLKRGGVVPGIMPKNQCGCGDECQCGCATTGQCHCQRQPPPIPRPPMEPFDPQVTPPFVPFPAPHPGANGPNCQR